MMSRRIPVAVAAITAAGVCASCVHEFPEAGDTAEVRLLLVHDSVWDEYEHIYTRGAESSGVTARYVIRACRKGVRSGAEYEFTRVTDDLSLVPYETSIRLPAGEWDLYVWQDLEAEGRSLYDATDFGRITYADPYTGHTDMRDVFEGRAAVNVDVSYDSGHYVGATVQLARPMAKYVFIATDFRRFYDETLLPALSAQGGAEAACQEWTSLSSIERNEALKDWSVTAFYPLFMPSVYSLTESRVLDSSRGMKYDATIIPLNQDEAVLAFDYVWMNPQPGGAQVQLVLNAPGGAQVTMTPAVSVPLKRGQITYVRGDFLTAGAQGGLDIDFTFSGDFNIEI